MDRLPSDTEPICVVVADSSRIHTQLLTDALARDPGFSVVGAHGSSELLSIAEEGTAEIAVVSSYLDEEPSQGCVIVRKLNISRPKMRSVLLLDSTKREAILEAFAAGARGIFHRHESLETLSRCVRQVHMGQIWANAEQMSYAVEALAAAPQVRAVDARGIDLLSKREREVVSSLAAGMSNREIGARLGLSQHTIKNYLFKVFDKLGVSSRVELLSLTLTQNAAQGSSIQSFVVDLLDREKNSENLLDVAACQHAADHGLTRAQLKMAELHLAGNGIEKDPIAAFMWYLLAEKTSQATRERISADKRKLAETLTTDQILEAQKRATEKLAASADTDAPSKAQTPPIAGGAHAK